MTRSTPSKVLFVHPSDELYGADRMLLELITALPGGVAAEVWVPTDLPHPATPLCGELRRRGIAVRHLELPIMRRAYRTPRALARLLWLTYRLARRLRDTRPAVVYCTTSATYLAVAAARLARVPRVVGHVQEFWSGADRLAIAPLASSAQQLIAISEAVADSLPDRAKARTTVVVNATPEPHEPPATAAGATTGRPLHYVVASRWNGWKGHPTLLAAWERAGCPGVLTVLGGAPLSGESVDVAALAARMSRPDTVRIVGEVADVSSYLAGADVVIMPSDQPEPFGLVAIEAFARGRPVIASAAGGLVEIVTDGKDGWLFPPQDVAALAAVLTSLGADAVQVAGAQARRTYERRFTTTRYAHEWREALFGADIERDGSHRGPR